jgi:hypothetical protein
MATTLPMVEVPLLVARWTFGRGRQRSDLIHPLGSSRKQGSLAAPYLLETFGQLAYTEGFSALVRRSRTVSSDV